LKEGGGGWAVGPYQSPWQDHVNTCEQTSNLHLCYLHGMKVGGRSAGGPGQPPWQDHGWTYLKIVYRITSSLPLCYLHGMKEGWGGAGGPDQPPWQDHGWTYLKIVYRITSILPLCYLHGMKEGGGEVGGPDQSPWQDHVVVGGTTIESVWELLELHLQISLFPLYTVLVTHWRILLCHSAKERGIDKPHNDIYKYAPAVLTNYLWDFEVFPINHLKPHLFRKRQNLIHKSDTQSAVIYGKERNQSSMPCWKFIFLLKWWKSSSVPVFRHQQKKHRGLVQALLESGFLKICNDWDGTRQEKNSYLVLSHSSPSGRFRPP
jgi:hypothetical protein